MSLLAATMQALRFNETQNKMILEARLSNSVLAERFHTSARAIQRQRKLLKELQESECPTKN